MKCFHAAGCEHAVEHLRPQRLIAGEVAALRIENGDAQADAAERADDLRRGLCERHAFAMEAIRENARLFMLGDHHVDGERRQFEDERDRRREDNDEHRDAKQRRVQSGES